MEKIIIHLEDKKTRALEVVEMLKHNRSVKFRSKKDYRRKDKHFKGWD